MKVWIQQQIEAKENINKAKHKVKEVSFNMIDLINHKLNKTGKATKNTISAKVYSQNPLWKIPKVH